MQGTDGTRLSYSYDEHNNIQSYAAKKNGTTLSAASYTYSDDGLPVSAMLGGENGTPLTYAYDTLNRLERISVEASNGNLLETEYVYADGTDGQTTGVVEQVNYFIGFYEAPGEYSTYPMQAGDEYVYDKNGNITQIINNGGIRSYEYDELNRLVRENDDLLDQTVVYTYDNGGNILTKTYYDYTTGTLGEVVDTITYTYDTVWKDKLLTYDGGETITYDNIGNPLTYNGYTFTWQKGRQLASASGNGDTITYKYGADGLRTQKTVNGVTTEYTYASGLLVSQTDGTNTLNFSYTADGTPRTVKFNNTTYYYIYNLQGDVQSIVHANGGAVVEYVYDTWGNLISATGTLASTLGTLNPFRYRGYVYDTETGFYYLTTRYYDPATCRFLNADGYISTGQGTTGHNMFAYCGNNPVMNVDHSGTFFSKFKSTMAVIFINTAIANGYDITLTYNEYSYNHSFFQDPLPITIQSGAKTTFDDNLSNSSKGYKKYLDIDIKQPIVSSTFVNSFQLSDFIIETNVGLDNTGICFSTIENNTSFLAIRADAVNLKIGIEFGTKIKWDDKTQTEYTNISISGWWLYGLHCLFNGMPVPSKSPPLVPANY